MEKIFESQIINNTNILKSIEPEIIETKKYEMKLNEDIYMLIMDMYSNENINFKISPKNDLLSKANFSKVYSYEELIKKLILHKEHYDNISKVFKFYDISLSKNRVSLVFDKNKKIMKLSLRKILDYDEIDCFLD